MHYVTLRIDWEGVLVVIRGEPQSMAKTSFSGHRHDECEARVFQRIDVAGEVTIVPKVECGPISVTCLEGRIIPGGMSISKAKKHATRRKCKVLFVQELLVEVPLEFEVKADCNLVGIRCGEPSVDPAACFSGSEIPPDGSEGSGGSSGTSDSWEDDGSGSSGCQDGHGESGSQE